MKKLFALFLTFVVFSVATQAQHHGGVLRAREMKESNWDNASKSWVLDKSFTYDYYKNGAVRRILSSQTSVEGNHTKEEIIYDTLFRVLEYRVQKKETGETSFRDTYFGTNCFLNQFESCGYTASDLNTATNNLELSAGYKWEPILEGKTVKGRISYSWKRAAQEWAPDQKEEYCFDNDEVTAIDHFGWDAANAKWVLQKKTINISWLDKKISLIAKCTTQIWDGTTWRDESVFHNSRDVSGIYVMEVDKIENGFRRPHLRKTYKPNEEFEFEVFITGKWLTQESLIKTAHWNYHKRFAFDLNGDTLDWHHHEYEFDHPRNPIHYWEFNDNGSGPRLLEYVYENSYDSEMNLTQVIQSSKNEKGQFEYYKKFEYSGFGDVSQPDGFDFEKDHSKHLSLFPNPSHNGIFHLPDNKKLENIKIYNHEGQIVATMDESKTNIDLSTYPSGMYLIEFEHVGIRYRAKVISL